MDISSRVFIHPLLVKAFKAADYGPFDAEIWKALDCPDWRESLDTIYTNFRSAFVGFLEVESAKLPLETSIASLLPLVRKHYQTNLQNACASAKEDLTGVTRAYFDTFELLHGVAQRHFAGESSPLDLHRDLFVSLWAQLAQVIVKTLMDPIVPF